MNGYSARFSRRSDWYHRASFERGQIPLGSPASPASDQFCATLDAKFQRLGLKTKFVGEADRHAALPGFRCKYLPNG